MIDDNGDRQLVMHHFDMIEEILPLHSSGATSLQ